MPQNKKNKANIIFEVCNEISNKNKVKASEIISKKYPFKPVKKIKRNYTIKDEVKIFIRDGFIDRYSGQKLIFPPALFIISTTLFTSIN